MTRWMLGMVATLALVVPGRAQGDEPPPSGPDDAPILSGIIPRGLTAECTAEWMVKGRNLGPVEQFLVTGAGVEVVEKATRADGSIALKVRADAGAQTGFREVRADGPRGVSNPLLVRVDHLPQMVESEPNDNPAQADRVAIPAAVAGVLRPGDLDHFRVRGRAGRRFTVEVEARRLGTPISPVVTILSPSGRALAQGRASRGIEGDCRMSYIFPDDEDTIIRVRDNLYGGGDAAAYRLRIDDAPFATGLYPLGGPAGGTISVVASGGTLDAPRTRTVLLPNRPGEVVEVGPFDGPGGPVLAPARLVVGLGPEVDEAEGGASPARLPLGTTANGRIGRPGEVDRYRVPVRAGDTFRIKVRAAALGSWLDSVVTLRDPRGEVLGENDDHGTSPDSVLDHEARSDGVLTVEIADRFGSGGPEYGYRLSVGPVQPDVAVALRLDGRVRTTGALNLHPGSTVPIRFQMEREGRTSPIRLRALGLPRGVTAVPVTVPPSGPPSGTLLLRVAPDAGPAAGSLRVVATVRQQEDGNILERAAVAILTIGPDPVPMPDRQVVRFVTDLPVRVVVPSR
jgi:hypothetical protein